MTADDVACAAQPESCDWLAIVHQLLSKTKRNQRCNSATEKEMTIVQAMARLRYMCFASVRFQ